MIIDLSKIDEVDMFEINRWLKLSCSERGMGFVVWEETTMLLRWTVDLD